MQFIDICGSRGSNRDIDIIGISQDSAWLAYSSSQFQLPLQHCNTPQFYDPNQKKKKRETKHLISVKQQFLERTFPVTDFDYLVFSCF